MIRFVHKDITTVKIGLLAHGVNCEGKMKSGVAKSIREALPKAYTEYMEFWSNANNKTELLGTAQFVEINSKLIVGNLFTQKTYRKREDEPGLVYASKKAIRTTLNSAANYALAKKINLYIPKIGSDRGGLDWDDDVFPIIEKIAKELTDLDIVVCLYP